LRSSPSTVLCAIFVVMEAAAAEPGDLARFLVERQRQGSGGRRRPVRVEAVLALPGDQVATGHDAIRRFYADLLAAKPTFVPGE
jgi:hypothetical protein